MSPKLPRITALELVRALYRSGWYDLRQTGSHLHLAHEDRPGKIVTVPMHPGRIIPLGTLRAILDQADLSVEDLRKLL